MSNNDDEQIYAIGYNSAREIQIFNILEDIAAEEQEKIDSCEFATLAAWAARTQGYIEEELARLEAFVLLELTDRELEESVTLSMILLSKAGLIGQPLIYYKRYLILLQVLGTHLPSE